MCLRVVDVVGTAHPSRTWAQDSLVSPCVRLKPPHTAHSRIEVVLRPHMPLSVRLALDCLSVASIVAAMSSVAARSPPKSEELHRQNAERAHPRLCAAAALCMRPALPRHVDQNSRQIGNCNALDLAIAGTGNIIIVGRYCQNCRYEFKWFALETIRVRALL